MKLEGSSVILAWRAAMCSRSLVFDGKFFRASAASKSFVPSIFLLNLLLLKALLSFHHMFLLDPLLLHLVPMPLQLLLIQALGAAVLSARFHGRIAPVPIELVV